MNIDIYPMTIEDYAEVATLWQGVNGVGLHDHEDSSEGIAAYLSRNPGMSFVARHNGRLIGAVLCGHDGRRGSINHLAVDPEYRKQNIGRILVDRCLFELAKNGIQKCNIVVFRDNTSGLEVWKKLGWNEREDLTFMQIKTQR